MWVGLGAGREDGYEVGKARISWEPRVLAGIQEDGLESVFVSHSLLTSNFDDGGVDRERLAPFVNKLNTLLTIESQKLKVTPQSAGARVAVGQRDKQADQ